MPDPIRLHPLIELREAAGLTQADMAERCGLHGRQSRKAVSAWEAGKTIPHVSRRIGFMRYLWHDLQLHQSPERFVELWATLVEEWEWEPLSAAEHEHLLAELPLPPPEPEATVPAPEPEETPVIAEPEPLPSPPITATPLPEHPSLLLQPTTTIATWRTPLLRQWRWLFTGLPLLALIWVGGQWWRSAPTQQPTPPPVEIALINGGFEENGSFDGWGLYEECDYQLHNDDAPAQQGTHYLAIANRRPRCYSFYQDLPAPVAGVTYRAAIWLRAPTGHTRRGRLTLWALADQRKEPSQSHFAVDDTTWNCLETTLTVQQPDYTQLRLEIYLDSHDGLDYHFDNAAVTQGTDPICPPPQLTIVDLQLAQPSGKIYPGATMGVQAVVQNVGPTAQTEPSFVRYWPAEQADGDPLARDASQVVTMPPLAPGDAITVPHVDLYLPLNLPVEAHYYLVADVAAIADPADFHPGFDRASQPFTVTPCSQGTLYCDVPADHWAAREIQAWYDAGISQGCRSNTDPFLNRPFCPDAVVQRWMMVFFLLRRIEGKDYQPTNAYQGLFEDVPADFDHQGALWIEALTTQRVDMRSDACPPRGEHLRFCPNDLLRRIDFVRALLELQRWDTTDVAGTLFADMTAGSQEACAAEYMMRHGYLPTNDPDCPAGADHPRFCPDAPLRRAAAAVMMSRALGLVEPRQ